MSDWNDLYNPAALADRRPGDTMAASDLADPLELAAFLTQNRIPAHMHEGIDRYLKHYIRPGKFLQAVFANDLMAAMTRADPMNAAAMKGYTELLKVLPARAWGSWEAVNAWCRDGRTERS